MSRLKNEGIREACGADLIFVGSHLPGVPTYLLGSNVESIVRYASCSVLLTRN